MRQSKFTETQIVSVLKEADAGRPVNEIWRSYGISSATYYKWIAKYGGLEAFDVKRLKEIESVYWSTWWPGGASHRRFASIMARNSSSSRS
jgi:hypothetical protein